MHLSLPTAMRPWLVPLLFCCGCSDYLPNRLEVSWRYDPSADLLTFSVESEGLADEDGEALALERIQELAADRRYLNLGGWPITWDFDELDAEIRDELTDLLGQRFPASLRLSDVPELGRHLIHRSLLRRLELESARIAVDPAGFPGLTQTYTYRGFSHLIAYLNRTQRRALTPKDPAERQELLEDLAEFLGPEAAQRFLDSAAAQESWYFLDGSTLQVRLPLDALDLARLLAPALAPGAEDQRLAPLRPSLRQLLRHLTIRDGWLLLHLAPATPAGDCRLTLR